MKPSQIKSMVLLSLIVVFALQCSKDNPVNPNPGVNHIGSWRALTKVTLTNTKEFKNDAQTSNKDSTATKNYPDSSSLLTFENAYATWFRYTKGDTAYSKDTSTYTLGAANVLKGSRFEWNYTSDGDTSYTMNQTAIIKSIIEQQMVLEYVQVIKSWLKTTPKDYFLMTTTTTYTYTRFSGAIPLPGWPTKWIWWKIN
jgi:hypothetical protein